MELVGDKMMNGSMKVMAALLFLVGTACGGGGGGGSNPPPDSPPSGGVNPTPSPQPELSFPAFTIALEEGLYWEYEWDALEVTGTSRGTSSISDQGRFRISLGAPDMISGLVAYPLEITGNTLGDVGDFNPTWAYIGLDGPNLVASADGATWQTVFDSVSGAWSGGGFFALFPDDTLIVADESRLENDFVAIDALRAGRSDRQDRCETIGGVVICGDSSFSLQEYEFYDPQLGVVGYEYRNNSADSGGGFDTIFNYARNVGLASTSLRNEQLDYRLEVEPNNQATETAIALQRGDIILGSDSAEDTHGGTTLFLDEREPNNTTATAQALRVRTLEPGLSVPQTIRASASESDPGQILSNVADPNDNAVYQLSVEDFFTFTLDQTCDAFNAFHVGVDGDNHGDNDFAIFLFEVIGSNLDFIANDIVRTPLGLQARNTLDRTPRLFPGTYLIAVDAEESVSQNYALVMTCDDRRYDVPVDIYDWYSLAIAAGDADYRLTIEGAAIAIFDADRQLLRVGDDAGVIVTDGLSAGSYWVGVFDDSEGYRLTVD